LVKKPKLLDLSTFLKQFLEEYPSGKPTSVFPSETQQVFDLGQIQTWRRGKTH
jgi:hypothetical protein